MAQFLREKGYRAYALTGGLQGWYDAGLPLKAKSGARGRTVAGTPEVVREELETMARGYRVEELVVVTITHDFKARVRSYELLADAFGLKG